MSLIKACQAEGQEERRKRERCSEQMESNSRGKDNEKGNFRLIERFNSLHWVIAP